MEPKIKCEKGHRNFVDLTKAPSSKPKRNQSTALQSPTSQSSSPSTSHQQPPWSRPSTSTHKDDELNLTSLESIDLESDLEMLVAVFPQIDESILRMYLNLFRDKTDRVSYIATVILTTGEKHEKVNNTKLWSGAGSSSSTVDRVENSLKGETSWTTNSKVKGSDGSSCLISNTQTTSKIDCNVLRVDSPVTSPKPKSKKKSTGTPSSSSSSSSSSGSSPSSSSSSPKFYRTHGDNTGLESANTGISILCKKGVPLPSLKRKHASKNASSVGTPPNKASSPKMQKTRSASEIGCTIKHTHGDNTGLESAKKGVPHFSLKRKNAPTSVGTPPNKASSPKIQKNRSASEIGYTIKHTHGDNTGLESVKKGVPLFSQKRKNWEPPMLIRDHKPHKQQQQTDSNFDSGQWNDFDILMKVFPDADPKLVRSLLAEKKDDPRRVASIGEQLGKHKSGSHQDHEEQVTWFWKTKKGKLVSFTLVESNALEKQFSLRNSASRVITQLPGSKKKATFDFHKMIMTDHNNEEIVIYREACRRTTASEKKPCHQRIIPQEALTVPSEWQGQSFNTPELVPVRSGSAEWEHIEKRMRESLNQVQVLNIERVQNKWLYRKYAIQRSLLEDKNGPLLINEKELFHGTRTTKPELVWRSEDGFDMRYSSDGMWGRGAYFAVKLSYSHNGFTYRHSCQGNKATYQVFLAHVLTGESIFLPPDRKILMPPVKPGTDVHYDSIQGETAGSKIFVLYKLDMAYPAYLITYSV